MASMTKGEMLVHLREKLPEVRVLPSYILRISSFQQAFARELECMRRVLPVGEWIVRSSSRQEDASERSNAGKFKSILSVPSSDADAVKAAVSKVYASYHTEEDEEVLIQPMMLDVQKSGVVFTADLGTCAPYYVVNFKEGADSEAVTSGNTNELRTFVCYKEKREYVQDDDMRHLLAVCARLEGFLGNAFLDIEFGIDSHHEVTIFQVRPIVYNQLKLDVSANQGLGAVLAKIEKKVEKLCRPRPFLLGRKTSFGVMPDWNPAEMLGARPKTLAVTLYKELITDSVWARQRDSYGYRDLTQQPLMALFCGLPYIDTRVMFNSFVPKSLPEALATKLVDHYLERLHEYPVYHDKIEFKIVFSCYYFGIEEKLNSLLTAGFTEHEIKQLKSALIDLTNAIIHPDHGFYKKDLEMAKHLEQDCETISVSDMAIIDKIYWLLEKCKIYGTLPFAGVARAGFVAVQLLQSLVDCGIISDDERRAFMVSLETVNKQMALDFATFRAGELSREEFLKKYGHVRPGSYDITSPRYDEDFDKYFEQARLIDMSMHDASKFLVFGEKQRDAIQHMLAEHGLKMEIGEFLRFLKEAIEGREQVKFTFMKAVSEILRLINMLGKRLHISTEDMAYLDIAEIKRLYVDLSCDDLSRILGENIFKNKQQYRYERILKMPSLILDSEEVYAFYLLAEEPNFIGQGRVTAKTVRVEDSETEYAGCIVFIRAADPGYDYLFTKGIAGLVTQYGGANSHMAIRCAEMGLPAAIGVGEQKYREWSCWSGMELDCAKKLARRVGVF